MSAIIPTLKSLKEKYDYCLQIADRISTEKLNDKLMRSVYNYFRKLMPLSREPKKVYLGKHSSEWLIVGGWIKHGSNWELTKSVADPYKFFKLIRAHGREITPLVRKEISEDFSRLVDLTLKINPYEHRRVVVEMPPTTVCDCHIYRGVFILPLEINGLELSTEKPYAFFVRGKSSGSCYEERLDTVDALIMAVDIIDYLVQLYERAEDSLSVIIDYNSRILKEMETVIAPIVIAEEIHG